MKHEDVDPLAPTTPPDRDTQPELTELQMFKQIRAQIAALASKVDTLSTNVTGALGQGQSVGLRMTELETRETELEERVLKLERQQMNGEHPEAT